MPHQITGVEPRSAARRAGLRAGDLLLSINGEELIDEIDYQALIAQSVLHIALRRGEELLNVTVRKPDGEPPKEAAE